MPKISFFVCLPSAACFIISSNSLYLSKTKEEYIKLIKYLTTLGFNNLNILFDGNPYILNLEPSNFEAYIEKTKDQIKVKVNTEIIGTQKALQELTKIFDIDDVDIQNESLEDIIRGIYEEA